VQRGLCGAGGRGQRPRMLRAKASNCPLPRPGHIKIKGGRG
jgi:hypothetical protein